MFTARPLGGGAAANSTVADPLAGAFSGLQPSTQYDVTVVGVRAGGRSPTSNRLSFVTPAANAPVNKGTALSPYVVRVRLTPPSIPPLDGSTWCACGAGRAAGCCCVLNERCRQRCAMPSSRLPLPPAPAEAPPWHASSSRRRCARCARRVEYDVELCPIAGPESECRTLNTGTPGGRRLRATNNIAIFNGRTPFTT